ncbi:MAG TPA: LysR family substrate-binding domain-containing protein [Caulobacteraceae bacterium]|jgi:DNA-binding transcriptional LysR family regulator|nr:LysR family substrate-binding domain-containing protein [Caulobacteraceae bacterium]
MSTSDWPAARALAEDAPTSDAKLLGAPLSYRQMGGPTRKHDGDVSLLRIGLCSSLSRGFLRELIRHVRAELDAPALTFLDGAPDDIIEAVSLGDLDIGFVYGSHDWMDLQSEELWRESLMVLMPDGYRLSRESEVKPTALRSETFLVAGDATERELHVDLLERAIGGTPVVQAVPVERATLIDLVSLGFGLAVTVDSALGVFHPGVTYRPIGAPVAPVSFGAVWSQANGNSELGPFLETARELSAARRL